MRIRSDQCMEGSKEIIDKWHQSPHTTLGFKSAKEKDQIINPPFFTFYEGVKEKEGQ